MSSSKTACRRRRHEANRRKYARLRKAGHVPQHTTAERRNAAAERERQRAADQRREARVRRAALPVAATVTAAAASVVFGVAAPAARGIADLYRPLAVATALYPWVPSSDSDHPDPPHTPEGDATYYTGFDAAGTARTNIVIGPVGPTSWNPWEAYGPTIFGD